MTVAPEHPDQYHWWRDRAACKNAPVALVDEAYSRPGGPVARRFINTYCKGCPVREQCLADAMERGEWGVWGGLTQKTRTRHGGRPPKYSLGPM